MSEPYIFGTDQNTSPEDIAMFRSLWGPDGLALQGRRWTIEDLRKIPEKYFRPGDSAWGLLHYDYTLYPDYPGSEREAKDKERMKLADNIWREVVEGKMSPREAMGTFHRYDGPPQPMPDFLALTIEETDFDRREAAAAYRCWDAFVSGDRSESAIRMPPIHPIPGSILPLAAEAVASSLPEEGTLPEPDHGFIGALLQTIKSWFFAVDAQENSSRV